MSENGNTDDTTTVRPRDGLVVTSPLQPTAEGTPLEPLQPKRFTPATREIPAEPARTEPRVHEPLEPESKGPDAKGPDSKPAMLDREATKPPSGDGDDNGGDNGPSGSDNPPSGNDNPPSSNDNPPSSSDNPPSSTGGPSGSVFVDTDKLSQVIPGLDGIMRQMYAIGNGTANALGGYQLDRGDSYGEAYVTTATPISSQILDGLSSAGSVFGDTAEGVRLTVHNYDVTEDNAVNSAGDLLSRSED